MSLSPKLPLYPIAKASAISLLQQTALVFLEFVVMLIITRGNPSSEIIGFTFVLAIVTVIRCEQLHQLEKPALLTLLKNSPSEWNHWKSQELDSTTIDFSGANLTEAYLRRADLSGAFLIEADLSGADLSRANLSRADLSRANLSGANLSRADLSGANLSRVNLSGANLSRANLSRADLSRANLSGANLSRADLSRADLSRANLSGAFLIEADLSGANLSRANLSGADLREAVVTQARLIDVIGISPDDRADLEQRGAIFEDSPGDRGRSRSLIPR
ncbi:pentapeptide repeat-containing protein [Alkalinema pantanalense CENA528]|uniref:pentapeptide repeat-containing protein n=1 Tax=Alkalinema pantanalense TaxID=1620705 RepID=UPI003D6FFCBD